MDEFKNSSNTYKDTESERRDCMEKTTSTGTTDNCTENERKDTMEKTTSTGTTNNGTENEGKDIIDGNKPSGTADNGTVHTNKNENDEQKYGFKAESAQSIQNDDYAVKDFIIDGVIYNVPIDVDINFDPYPILWTLENAPIPIRGHQTVPLLKQIPYCGHTPCPSG